MYAIEGALRVVFADINEAAAQQTAAESTSMTKNSQFHVIALRVDVSDHLSVQVMMNMMI